MMSRVHFTLNTSHPDSVVIHYGTAGIVQIISCIAYGPVGNSGLERGRERGYIFLER